MRLILILAAVAAALYFIGGKAIDSFRLKSIGPESQKILAAAASAVPAPAVSGGSIASSIQKSLAVPGAKPEEPEEIRVFRFVDRMPPELPQLGAVSALVDKDSRTVILRGKKLDVNFAMMALKDLDLSADSCEVRTWAVYVDRSVGSGWDLSAVIRSAAGADLGVDVGSGTASLSLSGDRIAAALDIISNGSAVDVLQRPHLTLLHGQISEVEAADEVPLPQVSVSGNGFSQSGIVYRKVGLRLKVVPLFLGRDRVRLAVEQENGLIGSMVEVSDGLSAPIISTQRVFSSVELAIGEAVVLGGVATEKLVAKSGFLRDTQDRQKGFLFVVLSTSPLAVRARAVGSAPVSSPFAGVPGAPASVPDASAAFGVLPALGSLDGFELPWISDEVLPVLPSPVRLPAVRAAAPVVPSVLAPAAPFRKSRFSGASRKW